MGELRQIFDANYFGHVEVIKAFQSLILKSKGLVAFTDSTVNLTPIPFANAYASSKAAFHQLGEILVLETNKLGIKILQVRSGRVESKNSYGEERILPNSIYHLEDQDVLDVPLKLESAFAKIRQKLEKSKTS